MTKILLFRDAAILSKIFKVKKVKKIKVKKDFKKWYPQLPCLALGIYGRL